MLVNAFFDDLFSGRVQAPTLLSIDVVRLDQAGAELRKVIEEEGIALFERPRAA